MTVYRLYHIMNQTNKLMESAEQITRRAGLLNLANELEKFNPVLREAKNAMARFKPSKKAKMNRAMRGAAALASGGGEGER